MAHGPVRGPIHFKHLDAAFQFPAASLKRETLRFKLLAVVLEELTLPRQIIAFLGQLLAQLLQFVRRDRD